MTIRLHARKRDLTHVVRGGKQIPIYREPTREERLAGTDPRFLTIWAPKIKRVPKPKPVLIKDMPTHKLQIATSGRHRAEYNRRMAAIEAARPAAEASHAIAVAAFDARMAANRARRINHKN